jgi:hypothetical protein
MNKTLSNAPNSLQSEFFQISFLEYIFVLVLIIYGGKANNFVGTFALDKPLPTFLPFILSIILAFKSRIVFNKRIFLLLFFFLVYFFATTIKYHEIHPVFFGYLFVGFLITYISVKALNFKLFVIFEHIIYYLSIFGLGMWGIQILLGGNNLFYLIGKIPSIGTFSSVTYDGYNAILYSIQPTYSEFSLSILIPRNCGFAWEPGGFAVFLCLAIFVNLFITNTGKKVNFRFWIFFIALLSTQSTTGYMIFIIILIYYFFQANMKIILLLLPIVLSAIVFVVSLPFIGTKILDLAGEAEQVDLIVEESVGRETTRNPQRFASFIIAMRDFKNNPILGFAGHDEDRWFKKINSNIYPISGIGNLMAQYGIIGLLFFSILLNKSSHFFSGYFKYNGPYLLLLIILLITISYGIVFLPIIMCFWMFSFFETSGL